MSIKFNVTVKNENKCWEFKFYFISILVTYKRKKSIYNVISQSAYCDYNNIIIYLNKISKTLILK